MTGGAGFIGSHLVELLTRRGDEVTVLDDLSAPWSVRPRDANVRFVHGDIRDPGALDEVFRGQRPDVVVHLAALVGVRGSIVQAARYRNVNVEGTRILLERVSDPETRVVFASSSSVYGRRNEGSFREDDALDPISPYADTKAEAERLCENHHARFGTPVTTLRFFTVYGPGQRPDMAISRFVRASLSGAGLSVYGDGSSRRDYTYVDDIVNGIVRAVDSGSGCRCFNLGTGRSVELRDLVSAVGRATGREPRVEWLPDQPGDVPLTEADVTRARVELGYVPTMALEDGLVRFIRWLGPITTVTPDRGKTGPMNSQQSQRLRAPLRR